jgi:hypothetical protein
MSQHLITLIGVVESLSFVVRDYKTDIQCQDEVLSKLASLRRELIETKLREASTVLSAERMLEAAIAGIYPSFSKYPEVQVFLADLQKTMMAEVQPPPLPSCSLSKKSVL